MDLCRRTAGLAHPLPVSQVGSSNIQVRLHYIDGNYTVLPEVVEASLGPHMQVLFFFTNFLLEDDSFSESCNLGYYFAEHIYPSLTGYIEYAPT